MADSVKQIISAGVEIADFNVLDSLGYIAGSTGSITAGANGSNGGRIKGIQSTSPTVPEPDRVSIPGDDTTQGRFQFDSEDTPDFTIDIGVEDLDQEAVFQGTSVYQQGNLNMGILQPSNPTYVDLMIILTSKTKSKTTGSDGVSRYSGYILPKVTAQPLGRVAFEGRQGAAYRYACIANVSDAFGMGETMRVGTLGTESGVIIPWTGLYRLATGRWTGDGSTTVFNTGKRPATTDVADFRVWVNGVLTTGGITISRTNSTLTFSVAPTNGAKITACFFYTLT